MFSKKVRRRYSFDSSGVQYQYMRNRTCSYRSVVSEQQSATESIQVDWNNFLCQAPPVGTTPEYTNSRGNPKSQKTQCAWSHACWRSDFPWSRQWSHQFRCQLIICHKKTQSSWHARGTRSESFPGHSLFQNSILLTSMVGVCWQHRQGATWSFCSESKKVEILSRRRHFLWIPLWSHR